MRKLISLSLLGLMLLSLIAAGGRTDEHRDTRRYRVTATPTVTLTATATPAPLIQPASEATPTPDDVQAAMLTAWSVEQTQRAAAAATYAAVKATQAARWLTQTAATLTAAP